MSKIDREQLGEWLSAYVDGELDSEQENLLERVLREDEGARRLLAELRRTAGLVSSLPRHRAPSSIAQDVQLRVERSDLIGGVDEPSVGPAGRRHPIFALLSMAAMLALVAGSFWMMWGDAGSPTGVPGDIVAVAPGKGSEKEGAELRSVERLRDRAKHDVRSARRRGRGSETSSVSRRGIAEEASAPAPPVPATRRAEEEGLLATATLDQKMIAGLPPGSVRTHRFDNEPVRLKVRVRSEAQRDAVTARLIAYLAERQATDLAEVPSNVAGRPLPSGTYYHKGDPKVNFTSADQRQILVHASRRQLDEMMSELADAASTPDSIALVAGPVSIRGLARARKALYGLDEPTSAVAAGRLAFIRDDESPAPAEALDKTGATTRSKQPPVGGGGLFDGLLRLIQLDPEMLAQTLEPTGDGGPEESAAPTDQPVAELPVAEAKKHIVGPTTIAVSDEPAVKGLVQKTYVAGADLQDIDQAALAGSAGSAQRIEHEGSLQRGESDTKGRGAGLAKRIVGKKSKSAVGDKPSSLVDRRLKAIEESRRRRKQPATAVLHADRANMIAEYKVESPALPYVHAFAAKPIAEHYVTLIVQVIVVEPKPTPPARGPKRPPKLPGKRRLETPPAE